ncbi:hypothetical protein BDV98DRAFT_606141 [Pterulicium gracile]|uniref:Uncharacterized protein n=1 Tax=Pterulicium gracile TaxID=1884261 RepID=A0A5C3QDW2_9AGAR|nr:hypothetical protein BDV98DRAFT_606141 [Pterula gracilis]
MSSLADFQAALAPLHQVSPKLDNISERLESMEAHVARNREEQPAFAGISGRAEDYARLNASIQQLISTLTPNAAEAFNRQLQESSGGSGCRIRRRFRRS